MTYVCRYAGLRHAPRTANRPPPHQEVFRRLIKINEQRLRHNKVYNLRYRDSETQTADSPAQPQARLVRAKRHVTLNASNTEKWSMRE
jgi:hypothetical protein